MVLSIKRAPHTQPSHNLYPLCHVALCQRGALHQRILEADVSLAPAMVMASTARPFEHELCSLNFCSTALLLDSALTVAAVYRDKLSSFVALPLVQRPSPKPKRTKDHFVGYPIHLYLLLWNSPFC